MAKGQGQAQDKNQQGNQQPGMGEEPTDQQAQVFVSFTREDFIEMIRELKRDPAREEELAAEAKRISIRRQQMVNIARQDERAREARQRMCQHKKPNGERAEGGQAFSNGKVIIFCLRCQKPLRTYWTPEVAQGMAIQKKMEELGLTEKDVREAMQVEGIGDPNDDQFDDFALGVPKGVFPSTLTT